MSYVRPIHVWFYSDLNDLSVFESEFLAIPLPTSILALTLLPSWQPLHFRLDFFLYRFLLTVTVLIYLDW